MAQTSEAIESTEFRDYVFESFKSLEIRDGYVHVCRDQLPEFIRIGNIVRVVASLNSHLKESGDRVASSNDLERFFEAVEGETPGRETVDPFATNERLESYQEYSVQQVASL